jgi:hypothetical protein
VTEAAEALRFSADWTRAIVPNGRGWDCCSVTWQAPGSHYTLVYLGLTCSLVLAELWLATGKVE